jgi:hypothetical protein
MSPFAHLGEEERADVVELLKQPSDPFADAQVAGVSAIADAGRRGDILSIEL